MFQSLEKYDSNYSTNMWVDHLCKPLHINMLWSQCSTVWTKIHSFPFSVQSCLRSGPFCPYPISWCIFSKPSKLCAVAHTEVFLCCWYMWVKEESFENRKIGILPSTKWKGFTKLELFSLMSDQSKLIFSRNTLSANIATPAQSLLHLYTQRSIWKAVLEWNSINLCYNKGQRLGVSSTQLRSRGMIDVSLHSTSARKEALSKQIANSQNILCVLNCPKTLIFLVTWNGVCTRLWSTLALSTGSVLECICTVPCGRIEFVSRAVNLWAEGRAVLASIWGRKSLWAMKEG